MQIIFIIFIVYIGSRGRWLIDCLQKRTQFRSNVPTRGVNAVYCLVVHIIFAHYLCKL